MSCLVCDGHGLRVWRLQGDLNKSVFRTTIYTYIYIYTHIHIYIYIYETGRRQDNVTSLIPGIHDVILNGQGAFADVIKVLGLEPGDILDYLGGLV